MKNTVLITGSSTGIGNASAHYFFDKGWNVIATMRNPKKRETSLHKINGIDIIHLDVTQKKSIEEAVKFTLKKYGRIDVIVNNAGYAAFGPFENSTPEQVKRQIDTNVTGLIDLAREVLPTMRKQKSGIIINVSSVGGKIGFPAYSLYNGTKFFIEGFSECLNYEVSGFGIKVKLIEPGSIKTDFQSRSMVYLENKEIKAYDKFMKKMKSLTKKSHETGSEPEVVAKTIYRAATDNSNKMRYPSGRGAWTLLKARKIMPERFFRFIVRKVTL